MELISKSYAFLAKGGPIMGVLAMCSIACVAIIFERWFALKKKNVLPQRFISEIQNLIQKKDFQGLLALCRASENSLSRTLLAGFDTNEEFSREDAEAEMEMQGKKEVGFLETYLGHLGTLAAIGPLLGLLGTVTGMIQTFAVIKVVGVGSPLELSGGISEALLNTAGGLFVGIPAFVFHRYFLQKVDAYIETMEEISKRAARIFYTQK